MSVGQTRSAAQRALGHVAALSSGPPLDRTLRITVNFHPDRLGGGGRPILTAWAQDPVYRSQFVTGTSNGSLTAHPGGDRWTLESRIFGGAYDDAPPQWRPTYGALDFRHSPFGAAPRFGSSYLRLTAEVLDWATFCYPDSFHEPVAFGAAARMGLVELALAGNATPDPLYNYIEAHLHRPVLLDRHVEAMVLDPCYRGTEVEAAAHRLPFPIGWHSGFRLTVDQLCQYPQYRGAEFVDLGAEIAVDGVIDPRIIGDAVRRGRHDPQSLKMVWHIVARYGTPAAPAAPRNFRESAPEGALPAHSP
ncbi:DUF3626 domain-containing protein [Phytohabitans suffuscus]|uniref:DUF3626 domain-containing protein n=1 Tax=Phytohabitans suffuscus TaxID=624315 RepID=UPI001E63CC95|nr:DUF3626 domain-containing protein [Phytohabitans suffuscus]